MGTSFFGDPAQWTRDKLDDPLLIASAPGLGKTHAVVQLAENHWTDAPILHLGPSHKSFDNVTRRAGWGHWQGHDNGKDDDGTLVRTPCSIYSRIAKGYDPGRECTCGAPSVVLTGGPTFAPVEYALAANRDVAPFRPDVYNFPLWVFDDVGLDKFVDTMEVTRADIELTEARHPVAVVKTLASALLLLLDAHTKENEGLPLFDKSAWSGEVLYAQLEKAFQSLRTSMAQWSEAWAHAGAEEVFSPNSPFWHQNSFGFARPENWPCNFHLRLGLQIRDEGRAFLDGGTGNPHVHVVTARPDSGRGRLQSMIRIRTRKYIPRTAVFNSVILDASTDPALLAHVLDVSEVRVVKTAQPTFPSTMKVYQLRDSHMARGSAESFEGDGSAALKAPTRQMLKDEIGPRRAAGASKRVGLITFKSLVRDCVKALEEIGYKWDSEPARSEIVTGYYYNLRGANAFIGCDTLVLVGYPIPNPQGLYEEACALFEDDEEPITTERKDYTAETELRNGRKLALTKPLWGYKDSRRHALLLEKSRAELYQAFHRARPFARETSVREVLLFTDVPVPGVPVDGFLGQDGKVFSTLTDLLQEGAGAVPKEWLVEEVLKRHPTAWDKVDSLDRWIRRNSDWLAEATGCEYLAGRGGGFRTLDI